MKKKALKTIAALVLAFTVAVPTTALAGYSDPNYELDCGSGGSGCNWELVSIIDTQYEEANSEFHWRYEYGLYECTKCGDLKTDLEETYYENHCMNGYSNNTWFCTDCGYTD